MKIKLLQNPYDKGQSWEKKSQREIEITTSADNRGCKPNVYFSILAPKIIKRSVGQMEIAEDLFIPTDVAIKIGKQLIIEARAIDGEWQELTNKNLIKEAKKRGFVKGVTYTMDGKEYKIKGALFVRAMYKLAKGTGPEAIDFYVINHKNGPGCIYDTKTNKWAKIKKIKK